MKTIHEKADTVIDVIEPILFCNITARKLWKESKPSDLMHLYKLIAKQHGYNLNKPIDMQLANIMLTQSALFN